MASGYGPPSSRGSLKFLKISLMALLLLYIEVNTFIDSSVFHGPTIAKGEVEEVEYRSLGACIDLYGATIRTRQRARPRFIDGQILYYTNGLANFRLLRLSSDVESNPDQRNRQETALNKILGGGTCVGNAKICKEQSKWNSVQ